MPSGYRYTVSCQQDDEEWDSFLAQTPGGHHVQSSLWAQVKSSLGWKPVRIVVRQQEQIVAGCQILLRRLLPGVLGIVSKGPVLLRDDPSLANFAIESLLHVAKEHGVGCLVVQPPNNGDDQARLLCEVGFEPMTMEVAPTATIQIDLNRDLDSILASMKKQTRRDLRHGLRSGLVGREGTERDLRTFCQLLQATSERQKWSIYPEKYFAEILRVFGSRGLAKLFIAEYEGEPICSQMLIAFGDTVIAKNSGWSGKFKNLAPNVVLEWCSIEWAKTMGYCCYDLEGIAPNVAMSRLGRQVDADETEQEQWCCYKFKYGGDLKLFPKAHIYHINPVGQWIYKNILSGIEKRPIAQNIMSLIRLHRG